MSAVISPFGKVREHHAMMLLSDIQKADPWISGQTPRGVYVWFGAGTGDFAYPGDDVQELTSPNGVRIRTKDAAQIVAVVDRVEDFDKNDAVRQLSDVSGLEWELLEEHELSRHGEFRHDNSYLSFVLRRAKY